MSVTVRLNGEVEEKIRTIALLRNVDEKDVIEELRRRVEEMFRKVVDEEYDKAIENAP